MAELVKTLDTKPDYPGPHGRKRDLIPTSYLLTSSMHVPPLTHTIDKWKGELTC